MTGVANRKFRMMLRRFAILLCLPFGLAACGVAVEQSSLSGTVTPQTTTPQTTTSQTTTSSSPASAVAEPDTAPPPTVTEPETPAPGDLDTAQLAPSVTGSIDRLIDSISERDETEMPAAADRADKPEVPPKVGSADDAASPEADAPSAAAPAPAISGATTSDVTTTSEVTEKADPPSGDSAEAAAGDAQKDTDEIVGNIIWNIESAQKGRTTPQPDPVVPVGPDPSLASDALEAAFAMLARREQGLPPEGFLMPKKAPGMMRIALLVPTSGANKVLGSDLQNGAELALFSLRNRQIELLVFDTTDDAAGIAAREAVQAEADIILGPLFSEAVVPARRVAAQAGVPMLALSNNTEIADRGSWLLGYMPEQQVDRLLGHALTAGRNKVGIIAASDDFGQRLARHARKRLAQFGITPEDFITLTPAQLADEDSLKAAVKTFRGYQPPEDDEDAPASFELPPPRFDAVLFAGSADFALRTAPVLAYYDAGPERVLYLGNAQWNQRRILTEPSLQGGLFTSRPTDRDDAFNALWSSAWDGRPGALARLSFDAMAMAAILAGQQRTEWNAALQSDLGYNGFSGAYRLLPDGGNQRAFEIREISDGVSKVLQAAPDKI